MRRREFIAGLGGAVAWPVVARAQKALPVLGWLGYGTPDTERELFAAMQRSLSEIGYLDGRDLTIEYRWTEYHTDRNPRLLDELVRRQIALLFVYSTSGALAAKAATKSIPIVFSIGSDPVEIGLVASLNRPGGNITGIYNLNVGVAAKRLELLHDLVPAAALIAYLHNPNSAVVAEAELRQLQAAARMLGVRLLILNARDASEFAEAFANPALQRAGALLVSSDAFFTDQSDQLIALAARYAVPAMYTYPEAVRAGGLLGYGTDRRETRRLTANYIARILKGEKPADLPVQQVTTMQLVISLKTAKALGLTFPPLLLNRADEVIE
jgi:putative tryptophan/tyrosine transport system substrate-binding protein